MKSYRVSIVCFYTEFIIFVCCSVGDNVVSDEDIVVLLASAESLITVVFSLVSMEVSVLLSIVSFGFLI